jgi:hypothetical protein
MDPAVWSISTTLIAIGYGIPDGTPGTGTYTNMLTWFKSENVVCVNVDLFLNKLI